MEFVWNATAKKPDGAYKSGNSNDSSTHDAYNFLLSGFLIALLLVLFFACKVTENNILVLAAYLRVISGSQWEKDMEALRKKGRPWFCHQNEFRHVLFGVLGIA